MERDNPLENFPAFDQMESDMGEVYIRMDKAVSKVSALIGDPDLGQLLTIDLSFIGQMYNIYSIAAAFMCSGGGKTREQFMAVFDSQVTRHTHQHQINAHVYSLCLGYLLGCAADGNRDAMAYLKSVQEDISGIASVYEKVCEEIARSSQNPEDLSNYHTEH